MKIKLFLVDSHLLFLEGLNFLMKYRSNIEVLHCSSDPELALNHIKVKRPDLVVTDFCMKPINGREFINRVRAIHPKQKLLILSDSPNILDISEIDGYISRDCGIENLIMAIKTIVLCNKKYFIIPHKLRPLSLKPLDKTLTKRENQVVKLLVKDFSVPQIARELNISKYTVETHKKNIYQKLRVHSISWVS